MTAKEKWERLTNPKTVEDYGLSMTETVSASRNWKFCLTNSEVTAGMRDLLPKEIEMLQRCRKCKNVMWPWQHESHLVSQHHDYCGWRVWMFDYERQLVRKARALGAHEYAYVVLADVPGEGEQKGENLAHLVQERWPGAVHDPDLDSSTAWAFLLPSNV